LIRVTHDEAETELAMLVGGAVALEIGWPEMAGELGVSRQAARQNFLRRHGPGGGISPPPRILLSG
jgi:hypothetical protein